jgi:hypothetical protein
VFCDHYLRVERCSNENSVDTAAERGCEDIGDLQTNQECECNDNGCVLAVAVVRRRGEDQVQVSQESAQVSDGRGALCDKSVRFQSSAIVATIISTYLSQYGSNQALQ